MSDAEALNHERRRATDAAAQVLSGSSPDVNAIFQTLVERFIGLPGRIGAFFSWWLSNIWIIAAIGVPAMLAAAPLLDKMYEGRAAERAFQLEMFREQADIEVKKLDRTMLGEGAMSTLQQISDKLDQQGNQTTKIQLDMQHQNAKIEEKIEQLAGDVKAIKRAQSATDRKVRDLQNARAPQDSPVSDTSP